LFSPFPFKKALHPQLWGETVRRDICVHKCGLGRLRKEFAQFGHSQSTLVDDLQGLTQRGETGAAGSNASRSRANFSLHAAPAPSYHPHQPTRSLPDGSMHRDRALRRFSLPPRTLVHLWMGQDCYLHIQAPSTRMTIAPNIRAADAGHGRIMTPFLYHGARK